MKQTLRLLLAFASMALTSYVVQAQYYGTDPGSHDPNAPQETWAIPPNAPVRNRAFYRQETINMYRHPDDGLPSEAPYITVPVQPGTGNTFRGYPQGSSWR